MSDPQEPAPKRRRRRSQPEPEVALGSLSQKLPVAKGTEKCAPCGSALLTRVPMKVEGEPVTFVSCQDCEDRAWVTAEGSRIDVATVLGRTDRK